MLISTFVLICCILLSGKLIAAQEDGKAVASAAVTEQPIIIEVWSVNGDQEGAVNLVDLPSDVAYKIKEIIRDLQDPEKVTNVEVKGATNKPSDCFLAILGALLPQLTEGRVEGEAVLNITQGTIPTEDNPARASTQLDNVEEPTQPTKVNDATAQEEPKSEAQKRNVPSFYNSDYEESRLTEPLRPPRRHPGKGRRFRPQNEDYYEDLIEERQPRRRPGKGRRPQFSLPVLVADYDYAQEAVEVRKPDRRRPNNGRRFDLEAAEAILNSEEPARRPLDMNMDEEDVDSWKKLIRPRRHV